MYMFIYIHNYRLSVHVLVHLGDTRTLDPAFLSRSYTLTFPYSRSQTHPPPITLIPNQLTQNVHACNHVGALVVNSTKYCIIDAKFFLSAYKRFLAQCGIQGRQSLSKQLNKLPVPADEMTQNSDIGFTNSTSTDICR